MEGVWAVAGDQGAGKSTLVAELLRRGERLFTDDLLFLAPDGGAVVAHAGPPVMNLPPRLPDGRSPSDVGRVLADIDGEAWVAVPAPAVDVAPLAVVVLLDRGDHDGVTVTDDGGLEHLLAHSLGGSSRERMASRFSLLADLVATTPVLHVRADAAAPASRVVDAVEHHLVDHGVAAR